MKNKAFTLVELLAIIVIIGILSLIVVPNIMKTIERASQKAYDTQIAEIENLTKRWASKNTDKLDENHLNNTYITLTVLKKEKYIEQVKIKNPKTEDIISGCVEISYDFDISGYKYKFIESSEPEANACDNYDGYIYTYNTKSKLVKKENHILDTAYNIVYNNNENNIKVIGNTENGLYDMDSEYVFRGNDVNNYVQFGSNKDVWRIISMDKTNNTLKVIRKLPIATNAWDSNGGIDFENATINVDKLNDYYNSTSSSIANILSKINAKNVLYVGSIDVVDNLDTVASKETSKEIVSKLSLMSISDYMKASFNCSDFNKDLCKQNNYLYDMINGSSTWTINNNGSQIWYVTQDGNIELANSSKLYSIYPVITLNSNITITDGVGTLVSPYVIE